MNDIWTRIPQPIDSDADRRAQALCGVPRHRPAPAHDGGAGMKELDTAALGLRLRRRREELGLTLAQLSKRSDTGTSTIHIIEHGRAAPRLDTLLRLSAALDMPISRILEENGGENHDREDLQQ